MTKKFKLLLGELEVGILSFNGNFIFELNNNINAKAWTKFGIIPVDEKTGRYESEELFTYINSRLPIQLRNGTKKEKIKYIEDTHLKVVSDDFEFVPTE